MLASAVRSYANRFDVTTGENIALLTNNDDGLRTRAEHIIDTRKGQHIVDASGRKGVKSITLNTGEKLSVDGVVMSGGWNPNVHLTCHKRGRPKWNEALSCFVPDAVNLPTDMRVIGSANGTFSTHGVFEEANKTSKELGYKTSDAPVTEDAPLNLSPFWFVNGKKRGWVDFQNDVTVKDITLAHQEGFSSVEHVKRYTTLGMATDHAHLIPPCQLVLLQAHIADNISSRPA